MIHNFHISDENDKKAMRLFKKIQKVGFMVDNGWMIYSGICVTTFVVIKLTSMFTQFKLFEGHNFLLFLVSVCVGGFFTSLYKALLNENGTYRKLSKVLKCSVFVKDMDLKEQEDASELDGVTIPDLTVTYDVNNTDGKVAILIKVSGKKNKVIALLDNSEIGKNKKIMVPSKELCAAIKEARVGDDLVVLQVCAVNNCDNGYVLDDDIDTRLITQEGFYKFYDYSDDE